MLILNETKRSIRWLLAEVTVVVLGITIAFQVEQWRDHIQGRKEETSNLRAVLAELRQEQARFSRYRIFLQDQHKQASSLVTLIQTPSAISEEKITKLGPQWRGYLWRPRTTAFASMRDSGGLDLISNPTVRNELMDFYGSYLPYRLDLRLYYTERRRELSRTLNRDFDLVPAEDFDSSGQYSYKLRVAPADFPTDPEGVRQLVIYSSIAEGTAKEIDESVLKVEELISLIEQHLSGSS